MMASASPERTVDGAGAPTWSPSCSLARPTACCSSRGCSEEQIGLPFDYRVLLTAPRSVVIERLRTRTGNGYGRGGAELSQVLADLAEVEPLLRRSADLVLTTTAPPAQVADRLLERIAGFDASTRRSQARGRGLSPRIGIQ